jgi:2-succinyl-6-hydroxy-2,4-cyclohexadiene-1-carboxylate synthase
MFRSILAGTHEVLTIDLPGHGENSPISASLNETADFLAHALPSEPFTLGGYSLGGRVALHFALRHRDRLSSLVVLSATLGIPDDDERAARRARDNALADRVELIGAEAFLDEWLSQPMFATLPDDPLERAARSRDARGLASSLRTVGTGTQEWLGEQLTSIAVPTLIVAGANDTKFVGDARLLSDALKDSNASLVPDAGHAAHLERPEEVAALIAGVQPQ